MKHFCLPRLGRFHAVERSRGPAYRGGGEAAFLGQKENARTQGAFFGSATFIRCRTTHTRTPCAAASKAPTAHGRASTVYHARCAAPCRIENTVVGSTDTRERVSSRVSRRWHLRVSCFVATARNRERVTALFDSRRIRDS